MEANKGNLLLVVENRINTQKYSNYLKNIICFDWVSTLNDAYQACLTKYYDLILIDLKLSLGIGKLQLDRINSLSNSPPVFKIRPHADQVEIILQEQRTVEDLAAFLDKFFNQIKESASFKNLRRFVRYESILRVLIKKDRNSRFFRANTLNISQGGLFITTPTSFDMNSTIRVQIFDIENTPIQATMQIVWVRPWDIPHQLPGIGTSILSFKENTDQYNFIEYIKNNFLNKK